MNMDLYGYSGKVLRVDLTKGVAYGEALPPQVIETYLGGVGFGSHYLYTENPENVRWSDPGNRLIMANGPFSNTPLHGSGTLCFVTKGPMTHLAVSTQANGYVGAWLKSCGYDAIVIQGCAQNWSYLYISQDVVEIRDGRHLLGKDTIETQDELKKEIGSTKGISVYCIGPAGENKVRFSVIMGDGTHTGSKGGVGAVMGSKLLKAIVVCRGKVKPNIYDRSGLVSIAKELHEEAITYLNGSRHKWGTNGTFSRLHKIGGLPVKNYTTNLFPDHEKMDGRYVRSHFKTLKRKLCFNCGINHIYEREVTEGPYKGLVAEEPEYEAFAAFGSVIGQADAGAVFYLTDLADRLGIDANEAGWVLGWVMECYEKGILKPSDIDGLDMSWGHVESTAALIRKIATRQGVGDLLAEGVKRAAEKVGGEAVDMAVCTVKGATPRGHDHRARWHELVDTCLTNTSTLEATFVGVRPHLLDMPPVHDAFSPWEVPLVNAHQNGWAMIEDCLGACRFNLNYPKIVLRAYNAVTNADKSLADMLIIGKRIVNVLRLFNLRNGLTPEMEAPSPRYGSAPIDGPAEGRRILDHWSHIREVYYKSMGWNPQTGIPLPGTLKALGLKPLTGD
jgi:aldehyde:ferredoxin oxidoreductase